MPSWGTSMFNILDIISGKHVSLIHRQKLKLCKAEIKLNIALNPSVSPQDVISGHYMYINSYDLDRNFKCQCFDVN